MYTIEEPYINTSEATEGNVPFFIVKDSSDQTVFFAVTRQECEEWIENQN
jgi:hypothetical protein